jgi:hypothetical protein
VSRQRAGAIDERVSPGKLRIGGGGEKAPAIAIPACAEGGIADQLPRHAERHRMPAGGDKHHRARDAFDVFLEVRRARHRSARPSPDALPAAGTERLHHPGSIVRRVRLPDARHLESAPTQRFSNDDRIADTMQNIRRVAPQRAADGEHRDGARMILEAREIRHRIAVDRSRRARTSRRGRARLEIARQRQRPDRGVLIEVGVRIEGGDVEAGARRGFGGGAGGGADD